MDNANEIAADKVDKKGDIEINLEDLEKETEELKEKFLLKKNESFRKSN